MAKITNNANSFDIEGNLSATSFNGKDIPDYPSSPTVDKVLTYNTDNTLSWKEISGGGGEPSAYIKSASTSGNTLTLTNKDNTTVVYAPTFTDTNYYHTPSYSAGLKIATGTGMSDLYVPTGTTSSTVSPGDHTHSNYVDKVQAGISIEDDTLVFSKDIISTNTIRINDDSEYYEGTDNFDGADIDTTYCSKGIQVKNADDPHSDDVTLSFPDASGTLLLKEQLLNLIYPVGSIYLSTSSIFNPNTAFGGTWVRITEGQFLVTGQPLMLGDYPIGSTGGYATTNHVMYRPPINSAYGQSSPQNFLDTVVPRINTYLQQGGSSSLSLTYTVEPVGGAVDTASITTHTETGYFQYTTDNRPPYLAVAMWKRTA